MIRRLTLQNWRTYEDITLDLGPGTTFIVAPNGIGKTSLMEAAAWAVFGDSGQRLNGAVRAGNSSGAATAEVELPDHRVIRISRTLPKRPGGRLLRPAITINGAEIDEPQAISELRHSYGADPGFLLRLAMPRGRIDASSPSDLGLHDHLCRIFGAEGLLKAIENLDQRVKAQEKLIKAAKQGRSADAAAVSALQRRVMQEEAAVQAASSSYDRVARMLDQAREAERFRGRLGEWQQNTAAYTDELARLAEMAGPHVQLDPQEPESVQTTLDAALSDVQAELEASRVRQAELRGRATAIGQHSQSLQSAPDDCPVCRRPLDAETISNAKSAHAAELAQIAAETERLRSAETHTIARKQHVSTLIEHFRGIRHPGPRPGTRRSREFRCWEYAGDAQGRTTAVLGSTRYPQSCSGKSAPGSRHHAGERNRAESPPATLCGGSRSSDCPRSNSRGRNSASGRHDPTDRNRNERQVARNVSRARPAENPVEW